MENVVRQMKTDLSKLVKLPCQLDSKDQKNGGLAEEAK